MRYQDPDLSERLAAEYVLGTLKGRARQRFERLLQKYPNLREDVEYWELSVNKLAEHSQPVTPPPQLWQQLEQRLFPKPVTVSLRWYERISLWRGLTAGSSLVAVILAIMLLIPEYSEKSAMNYVVVLNDNSQQPGWSITAAADMEQFYVRNLKPVSLPADQGCLLWVQPAESSQFIPIGRLPDDDGSQAVLDISEKLRDLLIGGKLTVTVENFSQAPPSEPSGPVEFTGKLLPVITSI